MTEWSWLSGMLDALPDIAVLVDAGQRIRHANRQVALLGWVPAELSGRDARILLPRLRETIEATTDGRGTTTELLGADGTERPVDVHASPIQLPDGEGLLITARDARDRIDHEVRLLRLAGAERRMVRSLQALLASMDEGVALLDGDGDLVLANDAMTALTGGPVSDQASLQAGLRAAIADGEVQQADDGRWLRITVHEEDDARLVFVRDITDERAAEAAHEAFIGVLSHELRTPVTTILGIAHLLGRSSRATDPDRRDLAEDLQAEASRLDDLVEDLLVLSRAQSGSVVFEPEPVLLQHAIMTALTAEASRYPTVAFRSDIAAGLPPVSGDATFVDQVLRNLIGNAGKYTVGTGNEVLVTAAVDGDDVEVAVLDRGPGFAPEDADRLFDLYFRSSTTARIKAGSGIGLYVARTLVQAMGGRIQARLRAPRGSVFTFRLPILQIDEAEVLG